MISSHSTGTTYPRNSYVRTIESLELKTLPHLLTCTHGIEPLIIGLVLGHRTFPLFSLSVHINNQPWNRRAKEGQGQANGVLQVTLVCHARRTIFFGEETPK